MRARKANSTTLTPHAHASTKDKTNPDREMGFERVEDPSQVQDSVLPAGGPRDLNHRNEVNHHVNA